MTSWKSPLNTLAAAATLLLASLPASAKDVRNYIFGHSLINHASHTPETAVPYWVDRLAKAAGHRYVTDGQFHAFFFKQHVPPSFQWGFPGVRGSGQGVFARANYSHAMLTALNYVQYKRPDEPYDGDNPRGLSPVEDLIEAIDWLEAEEPGIAIQLYVNWPDMAGYARNFPPTDRQFRKYNADTRGAFADWFDDLFEAVKKARPNADFTLIPAGPVMSELFDTVLRDVPPTALYVDNAPHGTETLYFLASLVTYVHLYGERPPEGFSIPASVDPIVREKYAELREAVWSLRNKDTVAELEKDSETGTQRAAAPEHPPEQPAETELAAAPEPTPALRQNGKTDAGFDVAYFTLPESVSALSDVDFGQRPTATGQLEAVNWRYATGPLWPEGPVEHFATRIRGNVTVVQPGEYVFF
ncbi:MAG: hypothetical protein AAFY59_05135 [Pseudomonadota bacterium]